MSDVSESFAIANGPGKTSWRFFLPEASSPVMISVINCRLKLEERRKPHLLMNNCQARGFVVISRDVGKDTTLGTCFMFWIGELLVRTPLLLVLLSFCNKNRLEAEQRSATRIERILDCTMKNLTERETGQLGCLLFSTNPRVLGSCD
jgi:hypothetical protein